MRMKTRIEDLKLEIEADNRNVANLMDQVGELGKENAQLKSDAKKHVKELEAENTNKENLLGIRNKNLIDFQTQIEKLESENVQLKSDAKKHVKELEAENKKLRVEYSELLYARGE